MQNTQTMVHGNDSVNASCSYKWACHVSLILPRTLLSRVIMLQIIQCVLHSCELYSKLESHVKIILFSRYLLKQDVIPLLLRRCVPFLSCQSLLPYLCLNFLRSPFSQELLQPFYLQVFLTLDLSTFPPKVIESCCPLLTALALTWAMSHDSVFSYPKVQAVSSHKRNVASDSLLLLSHITWVWQKDV